MVVALVVAYLLSPLRPSPFSTVHGTGHVATYYLALGDSLGTGTSAFDRPLDPGCESPAAIGYVCLFYRYLKRLAPEIQLENLSAGGADSCSLVHGYGSGSPCTNPLLFESTPSQLEQALSFLRLHPHQVSPITIDVGGNDLLELVHDGPPGPLGALQALPGVLLGYRANLHTLLGRLREAAPDAEIMITTQYDPIDGLHPLPTGWATAASVTIGLMNLIVDEQGSANHAVVADVASAFNGARGGAAGLTNLPATWAIGDPADMNVHPTAAGYRVYARTIIAAFGYSRSSSVSAARAGGDPRRP